MSDRLRTVPIDLSRRAQPANEGEAALTTSPRAVTLPDTTRREVHAGRGGSIEVERDHDAETKAGETRWGCPACGAQYRSDIDICPIDKEPLRPLSWIFSQPDVLVGCVVAGRYEIERVLGRGGMGTVYQVRHTKLGKRFALKVLRREVASDADSVRRFIQEAQIAAAVKHENLADVSDCGEISSDDLASLGQERLPFFVMEMLQGESLGERIRDRGAIDASTAAEVLRQCALGLSAAHAAGVIHRDLKPDNIFLTELEGKLVCKLLDFGVAKILSRQKLTRAGTVFGTPYYMSPEQASGGAIDGRTDIYALGVVLYEALTGNVPFSAETHMGVLTKHVFEVPRPIETVIDDPARLGALGPLIMRCLEKHPADRFADALALARAVEEAHRTGTAVVAERPEKAFRLREPTPMAPRAAKAPRARRNVIGWLLGALALLALVAVAVVARSSWHARQAAVDRASSDGARGAGSGRAAPSPEQQAAVSANGVRESGPAPSASAEPAQPTADPVREPDASSRIRAGALPDGHPGQPRAVPSASAGPRRNIEIVDPW